MKVKKEFYLPNKGVLSLYNISYLESDFSNIFSNKYFLEKQIEEEYHRKEEMAKANERVLRIGNRKV